jgi:hypothetical protein
VLGVPFAPVQQFARGVLTPPLVLILTDHARLAPPTAEHASHPVQQSVTHAVLDTEYRQTRRHVYFAALKNATRVTPARAQPAYLTTI